MRTVGGYWPYATTLFDYVRRAMPTTAPRSLTDDESLCRHRVRPPPDGIIGETHALNAQTLPAVKMPNRDGFIDHSKLR